MIAFASGRKQKIDIWPKLRLLAVKNSALAHEFADMAFEKFPWN